MQRAGTKPFGASHALPVAYLPAALSRVIHGVLSIVDGLSLRSVNKRRTQCGQCASSGHNAHAPLECVDRIEPVLDQHDKPHC